ncbi:MAG TPA: DUF6789 family protein [Candidatus Binatia bacterium]|jgi:hypothetical protein|nr:DUF6789 family protein [Candidatus Binatia bacterium]
MDTKRFAVGFGWGVVATIAMSVLMAVGVLTGMSPMPKPIPLAIVGQVLGDGLPTPAIMLLAAIAHLSYGGFWGAVLASETRPVTVGKGVVLGLFLWLVLQVLFLPPLDWGLFGTAVTPMISVATLILHLVYGVTLGCLIDRNYMVSGPSPAGRSA